MADLNEKVLREALRQVKYPGFSRDIVSFGLVDSLSIEEKKAKVNLSLTTANPEIPRQLKANVESVLASLPEIEGIEDIDVSIQVKDPQSAKQQPQERRSIPKVRYCIAVASGKGGVGKSTVAVNLACAFERYLSRQGKSQSVGIMDCDIYGPSIPTMLGIHDDPEVENNKLKPLANFGVRAMSMGVLVDEHTPVAWRGPMVAKTIHQFIQDVDWGPLEVLVIDLPPGTGDAHLSLAQTLFLDGAVIVTTPQQVAVQVASRGAMMFEKVNVPLIGVIENMSFLLEGTQGKRNYLFGKGGGQKAADILETKLLGQIPLEAAIREGGDRGIPIVVSQPESASTHTFLSIAENIFGQLKGCSEPTGTCAD